MKVNDEMQSLNEGLWTDFSVEELESRLETDPMLTCGEFLS